jgi:putative oxidoreductase
MSAIDLISKPYGLFSKVLDSVQPVASLILRLYVANVFWKSGVNKFQSWDSTVFLFEYEYSVPLLSPEMAAIFGTFTELFFPVLLALGLMGRFSAFVLFVFNIIAVVSYPALNDAGIVQHTLWGLILLACLAYGPGKLSLDHLLKSRWNIWARY